MIEGRAVIENIEKTRASVESLGGRFKGHYVLKDTIFVPKAGNRNLSDDFVRVRTNIKSSWQTKSVVLIRKQTEFKETGKMDMVIMRKEFDTVDEASAFIGDNLQDFKEGFSYEREGWEYLLDNSRVFIEDIKGWKPSIEIEAENEEKLKELFGNIGTMELVHSSVPEVMKRILLF